MHGLSNHAKGFLITFIGVIILTPDTLLLRLAHMDSLEMAFWRGLLMSITLFATLAVVDKGDFFKNIIAIGKTGIMISLMLVLSSISFVMGLEYASVAKVLIIIAITPMLTAIFSIFYLKEHIKFATWIAIIISFIGILIVISDGFSQGNINNNQILGSIFPFGAAIGMAVAFTLTRAKSHINMVPATALNGLIIAICLLPFILPLQITVAQIAPVFTIGLIILPLSFGLLALGPRYIPAPEVGLLLLLETSIGPIWVWLVLDEKPATTVIFGGVIVVTTLAIHAIWSLRQNKKIKSGLN